jgi:hypothetical protein
MNSASGAIFTPFLSGYDSLIGAIIQTSSNSKSLIAFQNPRFTVGTVDTLHFGMLASIFQGNLYKPPAARPTFVTSHALGYKRKRQAGGLGRIGMGDTGWGIETGRKAQGLRRGSEYWVE